MASTRDEIGGYTTCVVDVSPNVVDAEEEMTLCVKATPSPRCDLRGHALLVKDQTGASVAAPAAGGMSQEKISELQQLGQLHESGVLTDEEFAAQKAKILNS